MSALAALNLVAKFQNHDADTFDPFTDVDEKGARAIIQKARDDGRNAMTELEAKQVFAAYGLPIAESHLARTEDEAVRIARKMPGPWVLKIVSPDILHKSDAGGVKVNIRTEEGLRESFRTIISNAKKFKSDANIHGVLVCEMAPLGREVIVGSVNDNTFGPTIMLGLGGIFVEVLKDVTFRVAPVLPETAMEMFGELRSHKILEGVRGEKRLDKERLAVVMSRISQMVSDLQDEISEVDANPILLYEEGWGLKVVDARIILKRKDTATKRGRPYGLSGC
jgi:acetyltransferase